MAFDTSRNPARLYAATDQGLFFSDNAFQSGSPPVTTDCSQVQWTLVAGGLPATRMQNILVSSSTNNGFRALYASTVSAFYRSTNGGQTWALFNSGMPASPFILNHASIAQTDERQLLLPVGDN
jgi:hypothetical protein